VHVWNSNWKEKTRETLNNDGLYFFFIRLPRTVFKRATVDRLKSPERIDHCRYSSRFVSVNSDGTRFARHRANSIWHRTWKRPRRSRRSTTWTTTSWYPAFPDASRTAGLSKSSNGNCSTARTYSPKNRPDGRTVDFVTNLLAFRFTIIYELTSVMSKPVAYRMEFRSGALG